MKTSENDFDCIEMKRQIQEQIHEETKHMNADEFARYLYDQIRDSQFAWFLERSVISTPAGGHPDGLV